MSDLDWAAARRYYISDERHSYEDVSTKFGMSVSAIQAHQRDNGEDWPKLRDETNKKVIEKLPEKLGEKIAEINARHAGYGKALQSMALEAARDREEVDSNGNVILKIGLRPEHFRDVRETLVAGINIERKALGLDKPEVNVQANINNIRYIPPFWYRSPADRREENIAERNDATQQSA